MTLAGVFGALTLAAVRKFQQSRGLAVDGVVGAKTWAALDAGAAADGKVIWDFLSDSGLNCFAVAGVMGNLFAESGLDPAALENAHKARLGHTGASYTKAVNDGSYGNFAGDKAGYGLAQWTYHTRKQAPLDFSRKMGSSTENLPMQLAFLWLEIQQYPAVMKVLREAKTVRLRDGVS